MKRAAEAAKCHNNDATDGRNRKSSISIMHKKTMTMLVTVGLCVLQLWRLSPWSLPLPCLTISTTPTSSQTSNYHRMQQQEEPPIRILLWATKSTTPSALNGIVESLNAADYRGDTVHLEVVVMLEEADGVEPAFPTAANCTLKWNFGSLSVRRISPLQSTLRTKSRIRTRRRSIGWNWNKISNHNIKEQQERHSIVTYASRILDAWTPTSNQDRAIFFHDNNLQVSPHWYKWWKGAYKSYHGQKEIGALSLATAAAATTIKFRGGEPFLSPHFLSGGGWAPKASVWEDFVAFAKCRLSRSLEEEENEDDIRAMFASTINTDKWIWWWVPLYDVFARYYNYHTLHYHYGQGQGAALLQPPGVDVQLAEAERDVNFVYPASDLVAILDRDGHTVPFPKQREKYAIMSIAVGYTLVDFELFVHSARQHFDGDIWLVIPDDEEDSVLNFLKSWNIQTLTTKLRGGSRYTAPWFELNRQRWDTFASLCSKEKYTYCMAVDFRDSDFQDDPFVNMSHDRKEGDELHLFAHNLNMNTWHLYQSTLCYGRNNNTATNFTRAVESKWIINAGAMIATPGAYSDLASATDKNLHCRDDQVALNVAVYAGQLLDSTTVTIYPQGQGNVNNVAWEGRFWRDCRNRIVNHNCFVSPVLHQLDMVGKTRRRSTWQKAISLMTKIRSRALL